MSETGRRQKNDEVDPELLKLKVFRPGIGPVLAGSVLVLAVYLMVLWRADLRFALGAKKPRAVTVLEAVTQGDNQYVTLTGTPDLAAPARLVGQGKAGNRLVPALGASHRLWLRLEGEAASATLAYDRTYVGRVRLLGSLPLFEDLAKFVAGLPPQPRFVSPKSLFLGPPSADVHGNALSVTSDTTVLLEEIVSGVARVTVVRAGTTLDEASARAQLLAAGVVIKGAEAPLAQTDKSWTYEVLAPRGVSAVAAEVAAAKLYSARVSEKVAFHRVPFRDVKVDAGAQTVQIGETQVAAGSLSRVAFLVEPTLPGDARILLVDEAPAAYWYVPIVYGALLLVSAAMIWALARALLPERHHAPAPLPAR
jgi:hypothetical protein